MARQMHSPATLLTAGIIDWSLEVCFDGLAGCLRWDSITVAAEQTFMEGNRPLQCIRWIVPQETRRAIRAAPKQGVTRPAATVMPRGMTRFDRGAGG